MSQEQVNQDTQAPIVVEEGEVVAINAEGQAEVVLLDEEGNPVVATQENADDAAEVSTDNATSEPA